MISIYQSNIFNANKQYVSPYNLNAHNQYQRTLLLSKGDLIHIQYALIWKDKIIQLL